MGYVGVPLACAFAEAGFRTIGFDTNPARVADLQAGRPYISDIDEEVFRQLFSGDAFEATTEMQMLKEADVVLICVPTPLNKDGDPDLSHLETAVAAIAEHGHLGQLVVLESTTYPGTTREVLLRALTRPGSIGSEQPPFIAYSPERIDHGRAADHVSIPKVVAGLDSDSTKLAVVLYESVFADVRPVASVEIAEAAKLLENTFRAVNIALVNELKMALASLGIDVWDVIDSAASKPFGYMPFYPGPGVGGHCIAVDPTYLAWKFRDGKVRLALTETAIQVNERVRTHVVDRLTGALQHRKGQLPGTHVLIIGVSYKPNIGDVRESPALWLIEELTRRGAVVAYHDPHVAVVETAAGVLRSVPWDARSMERFDAAVICTDHDAIDYSVLVEAPAVIVDTRNAMARRGFDAVDAVFKA